ncbi:hypothetical protein [Amycolatopsis minnesotensis]|uniref:PIN-like domain-containing protein n=1 Tax=Amycolatopsis minnesotensis TaxID=337894 RepID=UPI0031DB3483
MDENAVTRTVRRLIVELGYRCHTPPEVFGTRAESLGVPDTEWLKKIAHTGWVVLNRDAKIMERPDELSAYRAAKVHMFYLPGEATRDRLKQLVEMNLRDIITHATDRKPEVWKITARGIERFAVAKRRR